MNFIKNIFKNNKIAQINESVENIEDNNTYIINNFGIKSIAVDLSNEHSIDYMIINPNIINKNGNPIINHYVDHNGLFYVSYTDDNNTNLSLDVNQNNMLEKQVVYDAVTYSKGPFSDSIATFNYCSTDQNPQFAIQIMDGTAEITHIPGEDININCSIFLEHEEENQIFFAIAEDDKHMVHIARILI